MRLAINLKRPRSDPKSLCNGGGPVLRASALHRLFLKLRPVRRLPIWAHYLFATAMTLAFFVLRENVPAGAAPHLYSLMFLAILVVSFVCAHGTGFYATVLSALLSTSPFTSLPHALSADSDLAAWLSLLLFVVTGFAGATIVEALRSALSSLDEHVQAICRDSERRRRTEHALAESEAKLRQTFELATVGVAHAGFDGRWLRVNPRLSAILGYSEAELLARTFLDVTHPEDMDLHRPALEQLLAGRIDTYELEKRFIRKDGSTVWAAVSVALMQGPDGAPLHLVSVIADISERKAAEEVLARDNDELTQLVEARTAALMRASQEQQRAEEALAQGEKLQALGQLAGGVAHDFNNLLQVVAAGAQILKKPNIPEPRRTTVIEGMIQAAQNARELTSHLLTFARKQPLRPEAFDLNERLDGMVELLSRTLGGAVEVSTDFAPDLWPVHVDPVQLEVAVLNLAVNARDAMPNGGRLSIQTRNIPGDPTRPGKREHIALTLRDTGEGMAPSVLARVLEPFFTTKGPDKGTGLGLSQVHGFAKQSGGDVLIDSALGQGTAVTLRLPRAQPGVGRSARAARRPAAEPWELGQMMRRASGRTVLVVEDNPEVADFAQALLADLGYETRAASDAAEAWKLLQSGARIDAVFSDVVLPGGMDGLQLASLVRERRPDLGLVLASGYDDAVANLDGGLRVEVLRKPYMLDELGLALDRALDRVPAAAQG